MPVDLENISGTQAGIGLTLVGVAVAGGNKAFGALMDAFKGKDATNNKHFDLLVQVQKETSDRFLESQRENNQSRIENTVAMTNLTNEIRELRAAMPKRVDDKIQ